MRDALRLTGCDVRVRDTGCGLRGAVCEVRAARYGLRGASYVLRSVKVGVGVAGFRFGLIFLVEIEYWVNPQPPWLVV